MPESLYLAANLVPQTFIYGHLQIVYEDAAGDLFENETTSPGFPYFAGDWAYPEFGRPHDTTSNTPGYGDPDDYAIVALDLRPEQTAAHVWELMAQIHASLSNGGHGLDYDINQNSNSYIKSVLSVVGIDVSDYLAAVTPSSVSSFPGAGTNIFLGAKTDGLFSGYDTPIPLSLAGTAGNDYIATGIGDDTLGGAAGNDEILSGDGKDLVDGGSGNDTLIGGKGSDTLSGGSGLDIIEGGKGNDVINGNNDSDSLSGNDGNDTISGGRGDDELFGHANGDRLHGGAHYDTLFGGDGDDTVIGGSGRDIAFLGDGDDRFMDNGQSGVHGADWVHGGAGNDHIRLGGGDDTATGGSGADTFVFFGNDIDNDLVADYQTGTDRLRIDDALWGGGLTQEEVISQFATVVGGDVVFDFGNGNSITLQGLSSVAGLAADLEFI